MAKIKHLSWDIIVDLFLKMASHHDLANEILDQAEAMLAESGPDVQKQSILGRVPDSTKLYTSSVSIGYTPTLNTIAEIDPVKFDRNLVGKFFAMPWFQDKPIKGCIIAAVSDSIAAAFVEDNTITVVMRSDGLPATVRFQTGHSLSENPRPDNQHLCDVTVDGTTYELTYPGRIRHTSISAQSKCGTIQTNIELRGTGRLAETFKQIKLIIAGRAHPKILLYEPLPLFAGDRLNSAQAVMAFTLLGLVMKGYIWVGRSSN